MKVRIIGSFELLQKLRNAHFKGAKIYKIKDSEDCALFIQVGDSNIEGLIGIKQIGENSLKIDVLDNTN